MRRLGLDGLCGLIGEPRPLRRYWLNNLAFVWQILRRRPRLRPQGDNSATGFAKSANGQ
jgi:hypothetical protein